MKRTFMFGCALMIALAASAQDFTSIFLSQYQENDSLSCITISPRMMAEIMKCDKEKDKEILEIIAGLKSMQILTSRIDGENYYNQALELLGQNGERYDTYLSYSGEDLSYEIVVRKKKKDIVEIVMMMQHNGGFTVINCTGSIKPEFISALAGSFSTRNT